MAKCTVLFALRFELEIATDDAQDFVREIILEELEGACEERLDVVRKRLGATGMRVDITAYP